MREILFRGKSIESFERGRWVYGFYTNEEYNEVYETPCSEANDHYIENQDDTIRVAPETIGQYTGLKDKNGKRIFEGDIVRADNGHISEVVYKHHAFCCYHGYHKEYGSIYHDIMEVIGTIHDNPELLEEA